MIVECLNFSASLKRWSAYLLPGSTVPDNFVSTRIPSYDQGRKTAGCSTL